MWPKNKILVYDIQFTIYPFCTGFKILLGVLKKMNFWASFVSDYCRITHFNFMNLLLIFCKATSNIKTIIIIYWMLVLSSWLLICKNHCLLQRGGNTFQGFIRVQMNLLRPINIIAGESPLSIFDPAQKEEDHRVRLSSH